MSFLNRYKYVLITVIVATAIVVFFVVRESNRNDDIRDVRTDYNAWQMALERRDGKAVCNAMTQRFVDTVMAGLQAAEPELVAKGCATVAANVGEGLSAGIRRLVPEIAVSIHGDCADWSFPPPNVRSRALKVNGRWVQEGASSCVNIDDELLKDSCSKPAKPIHTSPPLRCAKQLPGR